MPPARRWACRVGQKLGDPAADSRQAESGNGNNGNGPTAGPPNNSTTQLSPIDAKAPGLKRPSKVLKKFLLCVVRMAKKPLSAVRGIKKVDVRQ